jgi:hypothetical protein
VIRIQVYLSQVGTDFPIEDVSLLQSDPSVLGVGGKLEYEISIAQLPKKSEMRYRAELDPARDSNQSLAGFVIFMERKSSNLVFTYYIPSGMLVIGKKSQATAETIAFKTKRTIQQTESKYTFLGLSTWHLSFSRTI